MEQPFDIRALSVEKKKKFQLLSERSWRSSINSIAQSPINLRSRRYLEC